VADGQFECEQGPFPIGQYNDVWILDVDGARLVIAGGQFSTSGSETFRAELRQIVESIQVEP
jgi:hypothetical protein